MDSIVLGELFSGLKTLLFPGSDQCPLCREQISGLEGVCPACLDLAMRWQQSRFHCRLCGRPISDGTYCPDCLAMRPPYIWARSAALYQGSIRQALHRFKYRGRRHLARPLSVLLELAYNQTRREFEHLFQQPEILVPVPLHPSRLSERSYNQAELLARELGHRLRLPLASDALLRCLPTPSQVGLSRSERLSNLVRAFQPGPSHYRLAGRQVLLVDDILTTGATVKQCSLEMKKAGTVGICVLTVATGLPSVLSTPPCTRSA